VAACRQGRKAGSGARHGKRTADAQVQPGPAGQTVRIQRIRARVCVRARAPVMSFIIIFADFVQASERASEQERAPVPGPYS
jgi:hypothetical protein